MKFKIWMIISLLSFTIISCKKEISAPLDGTDDTLKNGLLVLNDGLFQLNNSSMSWVDLSTGSVNNQIFEERTGRQLGDTGNDMIIYGSKLYIVTSVSSTLEVLNAKTLSSIKQLSIVENGTAQQPQNITAINGEIYISTFGGKVWCIDTTTFEVKTKIQVGLNPDRITNDGTSIFVSNSGGLNNPVYDSTVSVINPITKTEIKRITVGINPGGIIVAPDHNIYVLTRGNYMDIPAKLHRINGTTLTKDTSYAIEAAYLENYSNSHFVIAYYTNQENMTLAKFNLQNQKLENQNFISLSDYTTFYGMIYSSKAKRFYLKDAGNYTNQGKINCYNEQGTFLTSYNVGLNPNKVIYYE